MCVSREALAAVISQLDRQADQHIYNAENGSAIPDTALGYGLGLRQARDILNEVFQDVLGDDDDNEDDEPGPKKPVVYIDNRNVLIRDAKGDYYYKNVYDDYIGPCPDVPSTLAALKVHIREVDAELSGATNV